MHMLVAAFCIAVALVGSDALDAFKCPSNEILSHPPVVNSSVYSYKVTIAVSSKNMTVEAYEMYDMANGTITMVVHFPDQANDTIWHSDWIKHDYNYNQTLTVDMDTKECVVDDLMHNATISLFGMGIENGFKNVEYPFNWNGDYNYTMGNETYDIDGVQANKYSTCLLFNNDTVQYNVDLYFSVESWNSRSGGEVPLQLVLNVNQTNGTGFVTETYYYTFSSYKHDSVSAWNPGPRNELWDVVCPGRKDAIPLPKAYTTYALTEEAFDSNHKRILSARKQFDFDGKLARADFIYPQNASFGYQRPNHHYTLIQDFQSGVQYMMDRQKGNCTIKPLNYSMVLFDVVKDPSHPRNIMMLSHEQYMRERNFTYTGRHHHKQFTVDSWTSTVPATWNTSKGSVEMHDTVVYTTPDWSNSDISPVLINRVYHFNQTSNGKSTMHSMMLHISGYTPLSHSYHTFDVSSCFHGDQTKNLVLKFDGSYGKYIEEYSGNMDAAIRKAVADSAEVQEIQVASWVGKEVAPDNSAENGENNLFVSVTLLDHPTEHANTTEYQPSLNLTQAYNKLKAVVSDNKFAVSFNTTEPVRMTAFHNYFKEQGELYSPAPSPAPTPAKEGLSKGGIVGLAIGMLVLGIIIGAVFSHYRNKRGNRQFGYTMQD